MPSIPVVFFSNKHDISSHRPPLDSRSGKGTAPTVSIRLALTFLRCSLFSLLCTPGSTLRNRPNERIRMRPIVKTNKGRVPVQRSRQWRARRRMGQNVRPSFLLSKTFTNPASYGFSSGCGVEVIHSKDNSITTSFVKRTERDDDAGSRSQRDVEPRGVPCL